MFLHSQCDTYALGVLLLNMVSKSTELPNTSYLEYVETLRDVNIPHKMLMMGLLQPDPRDRCDSSQLFNKMTNYPRVLSLLDQFHGEFLVIKSSW